MNRTTASLIRIHRHLLALYPYPHQREYAEERQVVFSMALARAAREGKLAAIRFVGRETRDLPLSIIRTHWRERHPSLPALVPREPYGKQLQVRHLAALFLPVSLALAGALASLLFPSGTGPGPVVLTFVFWALSLGVLTIVLLGMRRGAPVWALPSLGLVLGIVNLLLLLLYAPLCGSLAHLMVTSVDAILPLSSVGSAVAGIVIRGPATYLPLTLGVLALAAVYARRHPLAPFTDRIHADWSQLSFLIYAGLIQATIIGFSDYEHDEPFQLAGLVCYFVGIVLYLRARTSWQRLASLEIGSLLALFSVGLGIYWTYPQQPPAFAVFPRWYESLAPIGTALSVAAFLALPAWLVRFMPGGNRHVTGGYRSAD